MKKDSLQYRLSRTYRMVTSPLRQLPDFFIIGVVKGGTTSLYKYLIQHPNIASATVKEIRYFDNKPYQNRTQSWYQSHFPLNSRITGRHQLTGEASPSYFHNFEGPKRIFKMTPHAKIILCLRNPIDRAYSHYSMNMKNKKKKQGIDPPRSFEQVVHDEIEILQKHRPPLPPEAPVSQEFQPLSGCTYISSGIYIYSLHRWLQVFPKDRFLILKSEDLFTRPDSIVNTVYDFLKLSHHQGNYQSFNVGSYSHLSEDLKQRLMNFYDPYNQLLYDYLDRNFGWHF